MLQGIIYLATGSKDYEDYTFFSVSSLRKSGYKGFIKILHDGKENLVSKLKRFGCMIQAIPKLKGDEYTSRFYKTQLNNFTPFD